MEWRCGLMLLINILKSFFAMDNQSWDSFGVMSSLDRFIIAILLLSLYRFIIKLSLTTSMPLVHQPRVHELMDIIYLGLFLIFPPGKCWIFFLLLWWFGFENVSAFVKGFIRILQTILSRTTPAAFNNTHLDHQDLEMGRANYSQERESE